MCKIAENIFFVVLTQKKPSAKALGFFNEIRPFRRNKSHLRGMKSLRDEIRLAAGDMDGFNFIQAFGLDFISVS